MGCLLFGEVQSDATERARRGRGAHWRRLGVSELGSTELVHLRCSYELG